MAEVYKLQNDVIKAFELLKEAQQLSDSHDDPLAYRILIYASLAEITLGQGQVVDAENHLYQTIASIHANYHEHVWAAWPLTKLYCNLGNCLIEQGNISEAKNALGNALTKAKTWDLIPAQLHCLISFAKLYLIEQDQTLAFKLLNTVTTHPVSMFESKQIAQSYLLNH